MKIAVIGAGSGGLVTLKYLLDAFPAADIACFEQTHPCAAAGVTRARTSSPPPPSTPRNFMLPRVEL
jgi:hypothetical protein